MSDDAVDVLIIGAGAAGAAFAWSLAETRMNILCLEQGDWMESRAVSDDGHGLGAAPARRLCALTQHEKAARGLSGRRRGVADRDLELQRGRRQHDPLRGHFPRLHPSDFRTRTLDGVGDDWPIDYDTLAPYYARTTA
jgi:choline dehydrogenase-like flavoprotein